MRRPRESRRREDGVGRAPGTGEWFPSVVDRRVRGKGVGGQDPTKPPESRGKLRRGDQVDHPDRVPGRLTLGVGLEVSHPSRIFLCLIVSVFRF